LNCSNDKKNRNFAFFLVYQKEIAKFAIHFRIRNSVQMKKDIHPEDYRLVVFKDMSNVYISHKSHPFFTGIAQFVDTAGRIDKFKNRHGRHLK